MAYPVPTSSQSVSASGDPNSMGQKLGGGDDYNTTVTSKNAQSSVTCIYQSHIGCYWRNVTVIWSKNMMNHSLNICVDNVIENDSPQTCKIDLKPWHFWAKKGYKTFEVDGIQLEAYWDLRSAKFTNGPEPCSDFYVAVICDEEVVLLLGDYKKKAYKRTKSRPALVDAVLLLKKEHVFGKKSFASRAKFDRKDHDIVVESSTSGPKDPEMWISIDGIVLIHIKNLQWKFRGNQTIQVNKQPVQVFWDVHGWLFCAPGSTHGLFIFKPGAPDPESDDADAEENNGSIGNDDEDSSCSGNSNYHSTLSHSRTSPFSLFLYAWKID